MCVRVCGRVPVHECMCVRAGAFSLSFCLSLISEAVARQLNCVSLFPPRVWVATLAHLIGEPVLTDLPCAPLNSKRK